MKRAAKSRRADRRRQVAVAPEAPVPARRAVAAVAGPLAIALAAVAMLAWTWRTWPDPIIDYGRELYLAWQVAEGRRLYTDLSHFSGPFSVALNGLWFRIAGPGVLTLGVLNLALAGLLTALLYDLLARLAGRLAATAGGLAFVLLFACAQFTRIGNYNWVSPYSHELTHGTLLAVAALWALERHARTGRAAWLAGVGLALGLLVLTKVETLLAGGLAIAVGVGALLALERAPAARWMARLAVVAGAAAVPVAIAGVGFARHMAVRDVLDWPIGHWAAAARPELRAAGFYRTGMGLDAGEDNLGAMMLAFGLEALGAGVAVGVGLALRGVARAGLLAGVPAALAGAALFRWVPMDTWLDVPRGFPLWIAVVGGAAALSCWRHRDDAARRTTDVVRLALVVFAGGMLAKMLLNTRIYHYGFVLAMPATIVIVVAMVAWLPAWAARRGGDAAAVRTMAAGVLVAAVAAYLQFMQPLLDLKTATIGRGADAFRIDDRGRYAVALLREVEARVAPGETLLVVPQGAMINYLARRTNPTPYYLFNSTTLVLWREEAMVAALRAAPPDWVAYLERGPAPERFGRAFFFEVDRWITERYERVWHAGKPYAANAGPGATLLRRRDDR